MKIQEIPGLYLYENIIDVVDIDEWFQSKDVQDKLVSVVEGKNGRKVIHYGYKYNYKTRNIYEKSHPFDYMIKKLVDTIPIDTPINKHDYFNQCIINRYYKGEGISMHTDFKDFGDIIACYTFGDERVMTFTHTDAYEVHTEPGDLYIMTKDSRRKWKHHMPVYKGDKVVYSITFRNVPDTR
jgi:alkylated DNA repair dioxygenase AlkB